MDNTKENSELELASSSSGSNSDAVRNEDEFLEQELLVSGAVPNVLNFTKLKGSQMVLDCSSYFGKPRTVVINREQRRTVITSYGGYSQAGNKDILLVVNEGPEVNHVVVDVIDECNDIVEEPTGQREKSTLAESIGGACIKNASGETDGISFSGTGEYQQFLHVESCIKEGTVEKNDDAITMDRNDVGDLEVPGVFNVVVDRGQDVNSSNEDKVVGNQLLDDDTAEIEHLSVANSKSAGSVQDESKAKPAVFTHLGLNNNWYKYCWRN